MTRLTYSVLLKPHADEGGFTVTVPALPGCVAPWATPEEAIARVRAVIALHIEAIAADGLPVPVERVAPRRATSTVEVEATVDV